MDCMRREWHDVQKFSSNQHLKRRRRVLDDDVEHWVQWVLLWDVSRRYDWGVLVRERDQRPFRPSSGRIGHWYPRSPKRRESPQLPGGAAGVTPNPTLSLSAKPFTNQSNFVFLLVFSLLLTRPNNSAQNFNSKKSRNTYKC